MTRRAKSLQVRLPLASIDAGGDGANTSPLPAIPAIVDRPCRTWPKREFLSRAFYDRVCQAPEPVIVDYRCHHALREAWGFLKGTGKHPRFSCNPFYGCGFNCAYCYVAKAEVIHHGGPGMDLWGKFVFAKINFPQVLDRELTHLQRQGILEETVIRISSTTDAYQDAE